MKLLSALLSFALAQTRLERGQTGLVRDQTGQTGLETPECSSVPDRVCSVREVESPRQECQEEYEDILDTTITRHCQEILTTTCTQTTKTSQLSSAVVGTDSKVVASGVLVSPQYSRGRRTAETSAQSAPVCQSVPTKMCRETPVTSSRREVRRTCRLVREISVLEDCTETVTTQCVLRTTTVLHSQILEDPSAPDPPPASAPPAVAVAPPTPPTPGPPARPPLDFPE